MCYFQHLVTAMATLMFVGLVSSQFYTCHNDPNDDPQEEGILKPLTFPWLGVLQYIHVKTGSPHYFRSPRVVLITKQFLLSTAVDAAQVPENYALGNVVFVEYERDEEECKVAIEKIEADAECKPAVALLPIGDVLLHPEFEQFGSSNSLALLKLLVPIQSAYVVPACIPFHNYLEAEAPLPLFHVDFQSDVPRDYVAEEKYIFKIGLVPRELCYLYEYRSDSQGRPQEMPNSSHILRNRLACSTGCAFHSGAPSLVHEHTGHWTVVSIAEGGTPCPDPLMEGPPAPPARHIQLATYVPWVTTAITGVSMGSFDKEDPFGFSMPRQRAVLDPNASPWVGHWWLAGIRCYDRGMASRSMFRFYQEVFTFHPNNKTHISYFLEIHTTKKTQIVCVKVGMPSREFSPRVYDLGSSTVKLLIPLLKYSRKYTFQVEAWGTNKTGTSSASSCDPTTQDCYYPTLGGKK